MKSVHSGHGDNRDNPAIVLDIVTSTFPKLLMLDSGPETWLNNVDSHISRSTDTECDLSLDMEFFSLRPG